MKFGEQYLMENPLINGGGLVKTIEDTKRMAATAVGAVLGGSFTLYDKIGNSPNGQTVYWYDEVAGITYNSLGMPNKGIENMGDDLREMIKIAHDHGKPFILNFAPITDDPVSEVIKLAMLLDKAGITELDGLELNASCPNVLLTDGGRHEILSYHHELLGEVVGALSNMGVSKLKIGKILVRVSPMLDIRDAASLVTTLHGAGANVITAFNTFPGGHPVKPDGTDILGVPGGTGGQSGPGMREAAEAQTIALTRARNNLAPELEIIGSNGVSNAESMMHRLALGTSAVSATTLFTESRRWGGRWGDAANKLLTDYAEYEQPITH